MMTPKEIGRLLKGDPDEQGMAMDYLEQIGAYNLLIRMKPIDKHDTGRADLERGEDPRQERIDYWATKFIEGKRVAKYDEQDDGYRAAVDEINDILGV